jgi:heme A synthase
LVVGGLIVWQGVGPGCPGLPFCDERSSAVSSWLHNIHRATAALLVIALLVVAVRMMRVRGTRFATALNHSAALFSISQIAIGVMAVMQTLPEGLRVLHVAVATLIWWAIVTQWVLAYRARSS